MTKEKKPSITKLLPGTEAVGKAMGWSVEVVRLVARLAGCPTVRGGKGRRFVSIDAFRAWFEALPIERRLVVPAINHMERVKLADEICTLTWAHNEEGSHMSRLVRENDYAELVRMRDRWKEHHEQDERRLAAARAKVLA